MRQELSSRNTATLRKLQRLNKKDRTPERLMRDRRTDSNPPSSDLYRVDSAGRPQKKPVLAGLLDTDLDELVNARLVILDGENLRLSQDGVDYRRGLLHRLSGAPRIAFALAIASVALGAVGLWAALTNFSLDDSDAADVEPAAASAEVTRPANSPDDEEPEPPTTVEKPTTTTTVEDTEPETTPDEKEPEPETLRPSSQIKQITSDLVAGQLTLTGQAIYEPGVNHVEAVLVETESNVYWNPELNRWQERFRVFVIELNDPGSSEVDWNVSTVLPKGDYRLRTWARGVDGRGEDGTIVYEFSVAESTDVDEATRAQIDAQTKAIAEPFPQEDEPEDQPRVRVRNPPNGALMPLTLELRARLAGDGEIESIDLLLQDSSGQFWNFEDSALQSDEYVVTEEAEEIRREISLLPGSYSATARGTTQDGIVVMRKNEFTVAEFAGG